MKRFASLIAVMLLLCVPVSAETPAVCARAAVVVNGVTGEVIWGYNENEKRPMASTTKIMTAMLLAEQRNLDRKIVTTKEMVTVEGSSMGLMAGDTVSYRDLLYGMLLASGNDAANTTAIALCGSTSAFAEKMNERAVELGLDNTHFVTPSGLDDDEHYSTARDMAMLARAALCNEEFRVAAKSRYATLCYGNPPYKRCLKNHNRLLDTYEGLIGVKTGFTKKSGRCLVTAAERDGAYVIAATLYDPDDWNDHKKMLDYGFSCIETAGADISLPKSELPVAGGQQQSVRIASNDLNLSLTVEERQRTEKRILLPRFVYAGVKKGQCVGYIEYCIDNKTFARTPIVTVEDTVIKTDDSFMSGVFRRFEMLIKAMI